MTKEEARALLDTGLSKAEVAAALGLSVSRLDKILKSPRDPSRPSVPATTDELRALQDAGLTLAEIAAEFNLDTANVAERLRKRRRSEVRSASLAASLANQQREADAFHDGELVGERWVNAAGLPGYEVSDLGRVRSWKIRGTATQLASQPHLMVARIVGGFRTVQISLGIRSGDRCIATTRSVGALVLESFGPQPPSRHTKAIHLDGNNLNDRLVNLAWRPI